MTGAYYQWAVLQLCDTHGKSCTNWTFRSGYGEYKTLFEQETIKWTDEMALAGFLEPNDFD